MAYAEKYRLTFDDFFGNEIRGQILEDGYSGSVTSLTGTSTPIVLRRESMDNGLYSRIFGTSVEMNIRCEEYDQYDELISNYSRRFRLDLYKAGALWFRGWIEPSISQRSIQYYNTISLTAVCGVGYLRNIEFKNSGELYTGYKSLYSCIWDCLSQIDSGFNIYDGVDIWGDGLNTSVSPLTNEYVNTLMFENNDRKTAWDCFTVLDEILKVKYASLFKYGSNWYLKPCDLNDDTYGVRILSGASGTQITSVGIDINEEITNATAATLNVPLNHSAFRENLPALKEQTVNVDFGYNNNLFRPRVTSDITLFESEATNAGIEVNYEKDYFSGTFRQNTVNYDNTWIRYYCGSVANENGRVGLRLNLDITGATLKYVAILSITDGTTSKVVAPADYEDDGDEIKKGQWVDYYNINAGEQNTAQKLVLESEYIPFAGDVYLTIQFSNIGQTVGLYADRFTFKLSTSSVELMPGVQYEEDDSETFDGNNNSDTVPAAIDLKIGGDPETNNADLIYNNIIYSYSGGVYTPIENYRTTRTDFDFNFENIAGMIGRRIIHGQSLAKSKLSVQLHGDVMNPLIQPVYIQKMFTMLNFEYDLHRNQWSIEGFEVKRYDNIYLELEGSEGILETEDDDLIEIE